MRRVGLPPDEGISATEWLQRSFPSGRVQPLPDRPGGRVTGKQVGIADAPQLTFVVRGDVGGMKDPAPQMAVNAAINSLALRQAFVYDLGDIVYYHGDASEYAPQFYEPNAKIQGPIVAIPGNHDGDVAEDDTGHPTGRPPLDTFLANFCATQPEAPTADPGLEHGRHTQTQPSFDWALRLQPVTIVGLYSNVPEGGHLYPQQLDWLTGELRDAPVGVPLIVALHHPPLSHDGHHGGSKAMGTALDTCFTAAGRTADLVLSGHVHNYQRFARSYQGHTIPYVVCGNSGYHRLYPILRHAVTLPNVQFCIGDDREFGFLIIRAGSGTLTVEYVGVTPGHAANVPPRVTRSKDSFTAATATGPAARR